MGRAWIKQLLGWVVLDSRVDRSSSRRFPHNPLALEAGPLVTVPSIEMENCSLHRAKITGKHRTRGRRGLCFCSADLQDLF